MKSVVSVVDVDADSKQVRLNVDRGHNGIDSVIATVDYSDRLV